MINNNLAIAILAAGKGTRMDSELPKVLHKINNSPMIVEVVKTAQTLNPKKIVLIVGFKKELVKNTLANFEVSYAIQNEQKGTAHAIAQCKEELKTFCGNVLVLSGDVPLIKSKTLDTLIDIHTKNHSKASFITAKVNDPFGYGRIIRDDNNDFMDIIEHKDANRDQLIINEINSGIYIFDSETLFKKIHLVENKNVQKEYFITDVLRYINKKDVSISLIKDSKEILGVNTITQLSELENEKNI